MWRCSTVPNQIKFQQPRCYGDTGHFHLATARDLLVVFWCRTTPFHNVTYRLYVIFTENSKEEVGMRDPGFVLCMRFRPLKLQLPFPIGSLKLSRVLLYFNNQ